MNPSTSWTFRAQKQRAFLAAFLSLGIALVIFLAPRPAFAQPKEAAAKALQKKAMEDDYLATDFAKAQQKLESAITMCGADKCSAPLRAKLKRDLGVVLIGGGTDKEKGITAFADAFKIDPNVALDPDIKTKDLEAAFAEGKKRAGGGASTPTPSGNGGAGGQPQGDFSHTPAAEQQVRTPIPIYVEYGGEEALNKVIARYKGFGMTDWKTVELKKISDKAFGGQIPCTDVQQGATLYYIQGFNANNDPVATGGDRNNPYKVPVKTDKVADPPHLPNTPAPTQCADTGDCPPNFPGCKKGQGGPSGETKVEPTGKDGGEYCEEDTECKSQKCEKNKCTDYEGEKKGPRFWVGLFGTLDYSFVPSTDDVCKLKDDATPQNTSNYYCLNSDGNDYPYRPTGKGDTNPRGAPNTGENAILVPSSKQGSDKVTGGGALGNIRIMASLDYAVTPNILIGGRIGIVLNNYGGDAAGVDGKRFSLPIHLELRFTYVLGQDALYKKGFAPYFFGAAGIAPFETDVPVQVIEAPPGGAAAKKDVDAWHIAGPAFISVGGGGRYAVTPRVALLFGLRGNLAFLNSFQPSIGPEVGGQIGF